MSTETVEVPAPAVSAEEQEIVDKVDQVTLETPPTTDTKKTTAAVTAETVSVEQPPVVEEVTAEVVESETKVNPDTTGKETELAEEPSTKVDDEVVPTPDEPTAA